MLEVKINKPDGRWLDWTWEVRKKKVSRMTLPDSSWEMDGEMENTGAGQAGRGKGQCSGCSFETAERTD